MITVLETKLHAPRPRPTAIQRPRLLQRAWSGLASRLLLVSAPPGFGKSTTVMQAITGLPGDTKVAWLSLDRGDDTPSVFWAYVVAAIASAEPDAAGEARELLEAGEAQPTEVVRALINGLARLDHELVLVLDDLHLVASAAIHEDLAVLVDRLPHHAHLVILTRADPPLPLSRMRVRGDLVEIRAADLRFTPDEATGYLNDGLGLALDRADIEALDARTEGWIAALQLAAVSVRDRPDPSAFIASFAGDDRYVVDYLADEVLERQTPEVRDFLLATSVLDRLSGPLCDAVTGRSGGAAMLDTLDRANLLLVPLDDRRRWYRYHHLFADLLRDRLREQRPEILADLHRRACTWWWEQGEPAEAIEHALLCGDPERASDLIEQTTSVMRRTRQEVTLRRWLDALPEDVFDRRPVLAIAHAGALLQTGQAEGVERRIVAAERWLPAAAGAEARAAAERDGMLVLHPTALPHLPSAVRIYRAALATMRGDIAATIEQARAAYAAAPPDQPLERGAAAGILALAGWRNGDLDEAVETWTEAIGELGRAGHRADLLGGYLSIGDIRIVQGRLDDAQDALEAGLAIGTATPAVLRGTADMHVGLAEVALERWDLDAARVHLASSERLGDALGLPQHPYRRRLALAGLAAAEGSAETALALLDEAERCYVADMFPEVRPVSSVRARLLIREGRTAEVLAWADRRGLAAGDPPEYLREHEHITLAEALVAAGRAQRDEDRAAAGRQLVGALIEAAEAGGRVRSVVELLVLRGLGARARGDGDPARNDIGRALELAEPADLVRVFVLRGPALVPLLEPFARGSRTSALAARILGILAGVRVASPVRVPSSGLIEPLSEREIEVLRLLAGELDGPDIASHLYISVNTLRTHTRNIFAKLDVTSRRAAVIRAAELGLLPLRG